MLAEQNRTEQNRTEQNRTEQNRTEQNRTESHCEMCLDAESIVTHRNNIPQTMGEIASVGSSCKHTSSKPRNDLRVKSLKSRLTVHCQQAFTLAEVLITLGIIGILAAMTIPNLLQSSQEGQLVAGLLKFNSTLQQAVQMWKVDIDCYSDAYTCLAQQGLADEVSSNFDQIGKLMKISQKAAGATNANWLPEKTLDYDGISITWHNYRTNGGTCKYLLQDGMIFSVDVDPAGFMILVDVNGPKPPNRIGKDTFHFTIGYNSQKDISYYTRSPEPYVCSLSEICDSNNFDPTKSNGASPTSYVIINNKLPDFKSLSKTVAGFRP